MFSATKDKGSKKTCHVYSIFILWISAHTVLHPAIAAGFAGGCPLSTATS